MESLAFLLCLLHVLVAAAAQPLPSNSNSSSCKTQCGNISVPYPFGIGSDSDCFRPGFNLICNQSFNSSSLKLFLGDGSFEVTDILLTEGQVLIKSNIASLYCAGDPAPNSKPKNLSWTVTQEPLPGPYSFSSTRNTFVTISCGVLSYMNSISYMDRTTKLMTRTGMCASFCENPDDSAIKAGVCTGIGCCHNDIEDGDWTQALGVTIVPVSDMVQPSIVGSCTKAFVVDRDQFSFDPEQLSLGYYGADSKVPVVLDWAVPGDDLGSGFCESARKNLSTYACRSDNSHCYQVGNITYRCNCSRGFAGNPYVSSGCKDINECESEGGPCDGGQVCFNTLGSYSCRCPDGYDQCFDQDDIDIPASSTHTHIGIMIFSIGGGAGVGLLILFSVLLYKRLHQINIKKHKARCFRHNHGLLLQQLITSVEDDVERTKIFTLEELEKATNSFDVTRILGDGGHGTVYKGILSDQRVVAIKKSKIVDQGEIKQFINEVAILSQINHRNVVKLYGCCLEAEVPLLVYEFISGGTLSDHLHVGNHVSFLSFEDRLKIAREVAGALAYLHSSASISIFHRDVKSSNILLDHNYTAKISDFGASRSIPTDITHMTTRVQGTYGYLDPEYYHTGQLTQKSDVYSFGVILLELLTGEKAITHALLIQGKNLAMHFICSLKENKLFEVIDARVVEEGSEEEVKEIATLADMCLRLKGEERPTMKMVEEKLNKLGKTKIQKHNRQAPHKNKYHEHESSTSSGVSGINPYDATRPHSLEKEFMMSLNYPR